MKNRFEDASVKSYYAKRQAFCGGGDKRKNLPGKDLG